MGTEGSIDDSGAVGKRPGSMTIWKFPIPVADEFRLTMPAGAYILTVQVQDGNPRIWALVDSHSALVSRAFRMAGTGHEIHWPDVPMDYVGTFQLHEGALVFHLFAGRAEVDRGDME